jgi:hypothetical protein
MAVGAEKIPIGKTSGARSTSAGGGLAIETSIHAMLQNISLLDEICQRCVSGDALDRDQARWLGDALSRFLTRQSLTIEDAFGLRPVRGGVSWRHELAIRRRNAALVELARRHFSNRSATAQAKAIHTVCVRYAASAWRFDRHCTAPPPAYAGLPQEFLWKAFTAGAPMPIRERQLRTILSPPVKARVRHTMLTICSLDGDGRRD